MRSTHIAMHHKNNRNFVPTSAGYIPQPRKRQLVINYEVLGWLGLIVLALGAIIVFIGLVFGWWGAEAAHADAFPSPLPLDPPIPVIPRGHGYLPHDHTMQDVYTIAGIGLLVLMTVVVAYTVHLDRKHR